MHIVEQRPGTETLPSTSFADYEFSLLYEETLHEEVFYVWYSIHAVVQRVM